MSGVQNETEALQICVKLFYKSKSLDQDLLRKKENIKRLFFKHNEKLSIGILLSVIVCPDKYNRLLKFMK